MKNQIQINNLSLNIAENNVSIRPVESQSEFSLQIEFGMWGACMFGEPCILAQAFGSPIQWNMIGECAFGEIGILGMRGSPSRILSHRKLNVIRTN